MSWLTQLLHKVSDKSEARREKLLAAAASGDAAAVETLLTGEPFDPPILGLALLRAAAGSRHFGGATETCRHLLAAGADVDYTDQTYPLWEAVEARDEALVRLLVAAGADPTLKISGGDNALAFSVRNDAVSGLADLVRHSRPNSPSAETLLRAAECGAVEIASHAIESGVDVDSRDHLGHPALLVAANAGFSDIVALLLAHGASPNSVSSDERVTALLAAIYGKNPEVVRLLLAAGADARRRRFDDRTSLDVAEQTGEAEIIQLLEEACGERRIDPLVAAAKAGDVAKVREILDAGISGFDEFHNVLDRRAALCGVAADASVPNGLAIARALLDSGADIHARDSDGRNAIILAAEADNASVVELLLARGVSANSVSSDDNETPLTAAIARGAERMVELLILAGAALDMPRRSDRLLPADLAARSGRVDIYHRLVEAGAGRSNLSERFAAAGPALDFSSELADLPICPEYDRPDHGSPQPGDWNASRSFDSLSEAAAALGGRAAQRGFRPQRFDECIEAYIGFGVKPYEEVRYYRVADQRWQEHYSYWTD